MVQMLKMVKTQASSCIFTCVACVNQDQKTDRVHIISEFINLYDNDQTMNKTAKRYEEQSSYFPNFRKIGFGV